MRIALRRLRAALQLFRPVISPQVSEPLRSEIKWLNDELAPARDWDVFLTETVQPLLRQGGLNSHPDQALADLATVSEDFAARSFGRACEALRSTRYTRLLLIFGRWLVRHAWHEGLAAEQQGRLSMCMDRFAAKTIESMHRKVYKLGRKLDQLTPEQRHRLRIRVKKLRYAAEYVAEIYPNKRSREYLARIGRLQSMLGNLNDAIVALSLLDQAGLTQSPARGWVGGWHAYQAEAQVQDLAAAWKAFMRCKPFWC
jgi:CHAD domain-containing protein